MMTVKELANLTGTSVRTLQYYDIGIAANPRVLATAAIRSRRMSLCSGYIGNIRCGGNKPAPHFKRMTAWDIRQFAGFPFFAGFSKIIVEKQRKRRLLSWHFLSTAR